METSDGKLRDMIEDSGKIFERFGLTPMQGRLVAYFSISDPPEKTFDELVKFFMASKSSISNSLNWLLQNGIIDYKTYASDRKRYFFITDSFFRVYFRKVLDNVIDLKAQAFKTVSMRSPEYPEVSEKILRWIGNANLFEEKLRETLASFQTEV
jgi:DNA-binding transcriptional regulator GbsR (MarR family)